MMYVTTSLSSYLLTVSNIQILGTSKRIGNDISMSYYHASNKWVHHCIHKSGLLLLYHLYAATKCGSIRYKEWPVKGDVIWCTRFADQGWSSGRVVRVYYIWYQVTILTIKENHLVCVPSTYTYSIDKSNQLALRAWFLSIAIRWWYSSSICVTTEIAIGRTFIMPTIGALHLLGSFCPPRKITETTT